MFSGCSFIARKCCQAALFCFDLGGKARLICTERIQYCAGRSLSGWIQFRTIQFHWMIGMGRLGAGFAKVTLAGSATKPMDNFLVQSRPHAVGQ